MKQTGKVGTLASGILAAALAWTACAAFPEAPATVAASSLALNPQMAWARAIVFSDVIESLPGGRPHRLDQRYYLPMRLKEAGQVWVPQERASIFQKFAVGDTLLFEGTVEEFSRRYHVIASDGHAGPAAGETSLPWPDGLGPAVSGEPGAAPLSAPLLEALLADAQNSLNELAQANNVTVAQLIEAQTDGGRSIAEDIVADSLHGQSKEANSTAKELMVGAVLTLLRMQSALQQSVQASEGPLDSESASATEPPAEAVEVAVWDMGILSEEPEPAELAAEASDALSERIAQEKAAIAAKQASEAEAARLREAQRQARRKAVEEQQAAAQARARQLAAEEQAKAAALEKEAAERMRRAEAAREKEARRRAMAEAKRLAAQTQKNAAEPERPAEPAPPPEWLQPVWMDGAPDAADERAAEEKPAAAQVRASQLAAADQAQREAAREKKAAAQMRRAEAAREKKAQRQAMAEAKRLASQAEKSAAEPKRQDDPSPPPEWMKPIGY